MRRVIEGLLYDTDKATAVCELPCHFHLGDFQYHRTTLYRTKSGRWFLAGLGGPASMWAEQVSQNSWSGGEGLRPIGDTEAREYAEQAELDPEEMVKHGFTILEA